MSLVVSCCLLFMLSNANVAIKPSAEQVHLLCRGGARSRNSRISSVILHYQRCLWSALRRLPRRAGPPRNDNTLSTLSLVGFKGMLRFRSGWQNTARRLPRLVPSLAMTEYSITLAMTRITAFITNCLRFHSCCAHSERVVLNLYYIILKYLHILSIICGKLLVVKI